MPAPFPKRITQRPVVLLVTVAIVGSIGTGLVLGSEVPTRHRARLSAVTVEPGSVEKAVPAAPSVPAARSSRTRSKSRHVPARRPARRAARDAAVPAPIQAAAPSPYDLPVNPYNPSPYDLPPAKKGNTQTQTTTPPPDRTKPIIVIPAGLNRVIVVRSDGTFFFVLGPFSEDVAGTVVFSTDKPVSVAGNSAASRKRVRKKTLVLARKRLSIRAGKRVRLKVKLNKRGRRAIRRLKRFKVRAQFAVIDAAGNRSDRRFKFTLKAAKVKKHKRR